MFEIIDKNNCLINVDGDDFIYNVPSVGIYRYTGTVREATEQVQTLPGTLSHHNIEEIIRYNREKEIVLDSLTLILTDRCNLRCRYCYENPEASKGSEMSSETAEKAVNVLLNEARKDHGRKSINFFGGEPLLRFDLIERAAEKIFEAREKESLDIDISITTNATLLTDRIFNMVDRADICLLVSIDGDRETHDSQRIFPNGTGSYDFLTAKLARYIPQRPELFKARATIGPENMDFIALTKHLEQVGFQAVYFSIEDCFSKKRDRNILENIVGQYEICFKKYIEYSYEQISEGNNELLFHYVDVLSSLWNRSLHFVPCHIGNGHATIAPDGKLYSCQRLYGSNKANTLPLQRLDEGGKLFSIKTVHEKQDCPDCWARYLCSGGCPAISIDRYGDDFLPDTWRCRIKQAEIKSLIWLFIKLLCSGADLSALTRK